MAFDASVIVVGLGAVGSAALLSLASRGISCLGVDRFDPPHNRGSSHGLSRLIRLCYYEHPDYVPLLIESYRMWNDLAATTGRNLIEITGGLYIGKPEDPFIAGSLRTAIERGLRHDVLNPDQVRHRFPAIDMRSNETAFYEPTTGVLFPEECIRATLDVAKARGARVATGVQVLNVEHDSCGVTIHTATSKLRSERAVICSGAWMPALVPELASNLRVTRQVLAWFHPKNPDSLTRGSLPAWAISRDDGAAHYGFPMFPEAVDSRFGGEGFKVALHAPGPIATPDAHDTHVDESETRKLSEFLAERFGSAFDRKPKLLNACACMYTSTPDQHFLVDRLPSTDRIVVVSACSGHGFKMSPAIGLAAADLASVGTTSLPIGFLSWRSPFMKV